MAMTLEEAAVGAERQSRVPVRRKGGFAVVAAVLVVSVLSFVIGRATSPEPSSDRWHLGQAVVMSSGQVAIVTPSGLAPLVPRDVAWVDRSGGLHFRDTPECIATPGTVDLRWRQVTISHKGWIPQPVVVLIDCSK